MEVPVARQQAGELRRGHGTWIGTDHTGPCDQPRHPPREGVGTRRTLELDGILPSLQPATENPSYWQ